MIGSCFGWCSRLFKMNFLVLELGKYSQQLFNIYLQTTTLHQEDIHPSHTLADDGATIGGRKLGFHRHPESNFQGTRIQNER